MNIQFDLHTHTIASGHHTVDTVTMMAERAKNVGLNYLGISDHAPKMLTSAKESYFRNLKFADKKLYGVNMLYGVELNILNTLGEVDLKEEILSGLDYSIASLHKEVFKPSGISNDTNAILNAMPNHYINIIGHPENPDFNVDMELLTDKAKETLTFLEVNSASVDTDGYREKNLSALTDMIKLCKQKGVYIVLGSDSHGKNKIADFNCSKALLEDLHFPEELILNYNAEKFFNLVKNKRNNKS